VNPVAVRILHLEAAPGAGPLEHWLAEARRRNGDRLWSLFDATGAEDVRMVAGPPDAIAFGARLRGLVGRLPAQSGLVYMGSGAVPLATHEDVDAFLEVAASGERRAIANNRYSADIVAVGRADVLAEVPDLPGDNALPRWLEEAAGVEVADLRRRWRLSMDLDSPLDALLTGAFESRDGLDLEHLGGAMQRLRGIARDRRAELVVAGRVSATTVSWLERSTACRVRALVEERGLRASSPEAFGATGGGRSLGRTRPPRSILGLALDDRGPAALGSILEELGDGALIDTRVLLAHRLGADERDWPPAEDRFASDLLLPERVADPWLRSLTEAASASSLPIMLGGHSLVGPGVRLLLGRPA
jgi:hypothetical protein